MFQENFYETVIIIVLKYPIFCYEFIPIY